MIADRKAFITFLVDAKMKTYASDANATEPIRPGSREHLYSQQPYEYRDAYFGGTQFLGQETITRDGVPFWGMNYFGHALVPSLPGGVPDFLKEALRKVQPFAPYRGPRYYRSGPLEYSCTWHGELEAFDGFETIASGGQKVFELHFHGGSIF